MPGEDRGRSETIRAVARALNVLRVMNSRAVWPLQALHRATGLPKSTLSRLLTTLIAEGYVRAEDAAGAYRLTAKVHELDAGYTEGSRLVDAGRPIALKVTKKIKWPLALGVLDGDAMVVRFSSMPYSPLAVHTTTLGHRLALLESAMGRAFLAFASAIERQSLLDHLMGLDPGDGAWSLDWVLKDLSRVRAEGYAVRQPGGGRGSATLAVPLLLDGVAIAALSMTTFGKSLTSTAIAEHVPILAQTAREISAAFEAAKAIEASR